ncbi:PhrA family quorum-sensing system peptide [Streptococcus parasanguinis]|nr:PhrA family quorum-sensing system peptide [Streptococcus parasanguinis]MDU5787949.1 PhrA family quorum-sensing system peptide [Streptococcus parasanguinis]
MWLIVTITLFNKKVFPYQQFIQKNKQFEIRVQSQKKSNGLDVGKAD